jgi:hypothetical protein
MMMLDKIMLFNDPRQNDPIVLKQKIDYLLGCSFRYLKYHDIDFSPDALQKASKVFELLKPKNVVGHNKKRFGASNDGGYVLSTPNKNVDKPMIAYSFGIASYDPFSTDMANLGYQVFQYDGTVDKSPCTHPLIKFHKFNISGSFNPPPTEKNFKQILDDHGHHDKDIILQIDIEGAEWDFFESLSESEMLQLEQISVEYHSFYLKQSELIDRRIKVLEKINRTHQCIHLHANNHGTCCILNGFCLLPEAFEATYLRKKNPVTKKPEYEFTECFDEFPTEGLDAPCCPDYPDIYIGRFNFSLEKEDLNEGGDAKHAESFYFSFYEGIVKVYEKYRDDINYLSEKINRLHNDINSLHNEITEKTTLRYFAKNVRAFILNRLKRLLR